MDGALSSSIAVDVEIVPLLLLRFIQFLVSFDSSSLIFIAFEYSTAISVFVNPF